MDKWQSREKLLLVSLRLLYFIISYEKCQVKSIAKINDLRYNPSLPLKKVKTSREGIENRLYSIESDAI